MIIGIDIDDTITNTTDKINEYLSKHVGKKRSEMSIEAYREFARKYTIEIHKNVSLKKDAKEVIDYLRSIGYKIYIITLRGIEDNPRIVENTLEYLKNNNINYDKIFFKVYQKGLFCKENNISLMIDDYDRNINDCIVNSVKYLQFGKDVSSWKEIKNMIDGGLLDE